MILMVCFHGDGLKKSKTEADFNWLVAVNGHGSAIAKRKRG